MKAQLMITPDKDNKLDGRKLVDLASQLSGIVDKTNVYRRDKNGKTVRVNDDVVADLAKELDNLQYRKTNDEESKYKIIGKFDEDSIFYPNNYIVKDKKEMNILLILQLLNKWIEVFVQDLLFKQWKNQEELFLFHIYHH